MEYYGTRQDDTIRISVSNIPGSTEPDKIHIKVDSGDGNDTVTLEVRRRPNVSATVDVTQEQVEILSKVPSLVNPGTTSQDVLDSIDALTKVLVEGITGSQGAPATVGVDVKLGAGEDVGSIKLIDTSDVILSLLGNTDPEGNALYEFCLLYTSPSPRDS